MAFSLGLGSFDGWSTYSHAEYTCTGHHHPAYVSALGGVEYTRRVCSSSICIWGEILHASVGVMCLFSARMVTVGTTELSPSCQTRRSRFDLVSSGCRPGAVALVQPSHALVDAGLGVGTIDSQQSTQKCGTYSVVLSTSGQLLRRDEHYLPSTSCPDC